MSHVAVVGEWSELRGLCGVSPALHQCTAVCAFASVWLLVRKGLVCAASVSSAMPSHVGVQGILQVSSGLDVRKTSSEVLRRRKSCNDFCQERGSICAGASCEHVERCEVICFFRAVASSFEVPGRSGKIRAWYANSAQHSPTNILIGGAQNLTSLMNDDTSIHVRG